MTYGQPATLTDEEHEDVEKVTAAFLEFGNEIMRSRGLERRIVTIGMTFAVLQAMLNEDSPTSVSKQLMQMSVNIDKNAPHH